MVVDSDQVASMTASIARGVAKEDCRWVTDAESSALWDTLKAEIDDGERRYPDAVVDIPNEVPTTDTDRWTG